MLLFGHSRGNVFNSMIHCLPAKSVNNNGNNNRSGRQKQQLPRRLKQTE